MTKNTNKVQFWSSDKGVLVICIGISMIFWIFVKLSKSYFTEIDVPIQYDISLDRAFSAPPPTDIVAQVSGNGWDLFFLSLSKIPSLHLSIDPDLENHIFSNRDLQKKISTLLSTNIVVNDINYDNIHIKTEHLEKRKVPIHLKTDIHFKSGHWFSDKIKYQPDSVTVVGPSSEINHLSFWDTQPLVVNELESTMSIDIGLEKPINAEVKLSPETINVEIPVEEQTEKSFFIPVQYINNKDSIKIFPAKVKVSATVGLSKFDKLNLHDYAIVIDFQKIKENGNQNTIPVSLQRKPDYVRNIQFNPSFIEYFIVQKDVK